MDRELLELAAKACGLEEAKMRIEFNQWNPLIDDGDALRLAVKLRIDLRNFHSNEVSAQFKLHDQPGWQEHSEDREADPYAATRRAITRAAAEIGRGMK